MPTPAWPPGPTPWQLRLEACFWYRSPREDWSKLDWELYAVNMEERGLQLVERLEAAERELLECRVRLARSPADRHRNIVDLDRYNRREFWFSPTVAHSKRGRHRDDQVHTRASEALALRMELEGQSGKAISNEVALARWYANRGLAAIRAKSDSAAVNAMRRLLSAQNKRT
jgi:hypothetical protein